MKLCHSPNCSGALGNEVNEKVMEHQETARTHQASHSNPIRHTYYTYTYTCTCTYAYTPYATPSPVASPAAEHSYGRLI